MLEQQQQQARGAGFSRFTSRVLLESGDKVDICGEDPNLVYDPAAVAEGKPCGGVQPVYKIHNGIFIQAVWPKGFPAPPPLEIEDIEDLLEMSDEEHHLFGLNPKVSNARDAIIRSLVASSSTIRPPRERNEGDGSRGQDELTSKLRDVIRANTQLGNAMKIKRGERQPHPRSKAAILLQQAAERARIIEEAAARGEEPPPPPPPPPPSAAQQRRQRQYRRKDNQEAKDPVTQAWEVLQYEVATYWKNKIPHLRPNQQRSTKLVKPVNQRWVGKLGRWRGNLLGKRTNFSARTVITGDAYLPINGVCVPDFIAKTLTKVEVVNQWNIQTLQAKVTRGPNHHPGAKYVINSRGDRYDLRKPNRQSLKLQIGWLVESHLEDDDFGLFGRQPSLHEKSIMGHRIKHLPPGTQRTFAFNQCNCDVYNADFDGDEMNLHVPRNRLAMEEVRCLMDAEDLALNARNGECVIRLIQDAVDAAYILTQRTTFVAKNRLMQMLAPLEEPWTRMPTDVEPLPHAPLEEEGQEPRPRQWSGTQIFSCLLPKLVHYVTPRVQIRNGQIDPYTCEGLTKTDLNKITHIIAKDGGSKMACKFLHEAQLMLMVFLKHIGLTASLADVTNLEQPYTDTLMKRATDAIDANLVPTDAKYMMLVNRVCDVTSKNAALAAASKRHFSRQADYGMHIMIQAGSKGKDLNLDQMRTTVRQQVMSHGKPTQPIIHYGSQRITRQRKRVGQARSLGFVQSSYTQGLRPDEYFFHCIAGREGIVDTSVKTSETGYIYRRIVKCIEDNIVNWDGSVTNSEGRQFLADGRVIEGRIIQEQYGEDGMDGSYKEPVKSQLLELPVNEDLKKHYSWLHANVGEQLSKAARQRWREQLKAAPTRRALEIHVTKLIEVRDGLQDVMNRDPGPLDHVIPFERLLSRHGALNKTTNLTPIEAWILVEHFIEHDLPKMKVFVGASGQYRLQNDPIFQDINEALVRDFLSPKRIICEWHLNKDDLLAAMHEIITLPHRYAIEPGKAVGAKGGQSIGEPATQMTLNTFHTPGQDISQRHTAGVPRIKEMVNCTSSAAQENRSMQIFTKPGVFTTRSQVEQAATRLVGLQLKDVIDSLDVEPGLPTTDINLLPANWKTENYSPITIVLQLNGPKCVKYGFRPLDIATLIQKSITDRGEHFIETTPATTHFRGWSIRIRLCVHSDLYRQHILPVVEEGTIASAAATVPGTTASGISEAIAAATAAVAAVPVVTDWDKVAFRHRTLANIWLEDIGLRGIEGIYAYEVQDLGNNDWCIHTRGINLAEVLLLEWVCDKRTRCNDPWATLAVRGLEAARTCMIQELSGPLERNNTKVHKCHVALVVDNMLHRGTLDSATRHRMMKAVTNFLPRCAFEQTPENYGVAAAYGEYDTLSGLTEATIMGKRHPTGTGAVHVKLGPRCMRPAPPALIAANHAERQKIARQFNQSVFLGLDNKRFNQLLPVNSGIATEPDYSDFIQDFRPPVAAATSTHSVMFDPIEPDWGFASAPASIPLLPPRPTRVLYQAPANLDVTDPAPPPPRRGRGRPPCLNRKMTEEPGMWEIQIQPETAAAAAVAAAAAAAAASEPISPS